MTAVHHCALRFVAVQGRVCLVDTEQLNRNPGGADGWFPLAFLNQSVVNGSLRQKAFQVILSPPCMDLGRVL